MRLGVCEARGAMSASCDQIWAGDLEGAEEISKWGTLEVRLTRVDLWVSHWG